MKNEKNENKNNIINYIINKGVILPSKKYSLKYNLLCFLLITSFLIITIPVIFTKIISKKNNEQKIYLRNTESNDYSIDKSKTLEKNGEKIYYDNGKINLNKLDISYNGTTIPDLSKFNHIHITLCLNEDYHLLASVTIASILTNANPTSYIHFHIITLNNLKFGIMKKIYSLKSINKNSEFIFYNGKKVEEDFELGIKVSQRGAIDYGRLLITELLSNNIEKIISLDIGDIIVEKDLFELYQKDLGYQGYLGVEDAYPKCFLVSIFNHKYKYVNGGVIVINVKKWKEINLYQYIVKMFKYILTKTKFYNPYADILNDFLPWYSNGLMPLKYNLPEYITVNDNAQKDYEIWTKKCSYYFGNKNIVIEAEKNVVIRNLQNYKVYKGEGSEEVKNLWKSYAQKTGFYEEICKKYTC